MEFNENWIVKFYSTNIENVLRISLFTNNKDIYYFINNISSLIPYSTTLLQNTILQKHVFNYAYEILSFLLCGKFSEHFPI